MSLLETQTFYYDLCSKPGTIQAFKKNKEKVLRKYFKSARDRAYLTAYPTERFQTYRNHISNGILGGISSCFPVLKTLISDKEWNDILNDFYLKRLTRSPIARHVFGEFSHYLQKNYRGPLLKKLPYLKELAEYEYLDLKLFFERDNQKKFRFVDNLPNTAKEIFSLIPVLNPHMETRLYRWPVHKISRNYSKPNQVKRGKYGLIVYRDPHKLNVRFMEANHSMLKLIENLKSKPLTLKKLFEKTLGKSLSEKTSLELFQAIGFLKEKQVILGYQK